MSRDDSDLTAMLEPAPGVRSGGLKGRLRRALSLNAGAALREEDEDDFDVGEAEKRMEKVVRAQGRLTKKGGKMVSSGTGEFQIAGGYALEKLVNMRT